MKLTRLVVFSAIMTSGFPAPWCRADEDWEVPVTLGKDGWMIYKNARFGCVIPVPPGMKALRSPENGGGQAFVSADGKVSLTVAGFFNVEGSGDLDANWKTALATPDRTITYKRKTAEWYVVSGFLKDGTGFYEKYAANKKYGAVWSMTYPQAEEKKYAAWVERVAKGFDPGFGKGADTIGD